jgi:hypothetical protein
LTSLTVVPVSSAECGRHLSIGVACRAASDIACTGFDGSVDWCLGDRESKSEGSQEQKDTGEKLHGCEEKRRARDSDGRGNERGIGWTVDLELQRKCTIRVVLIYLGLYFDGRFRNISLVPWTIVHQIDQVRGVHFARSSQKHQHLRSHPSQII